MNRLLRLAALFLLASSCRNAVERKAPQYPAAPVVIISIDSLRADRLPIFGYQRVKTPHLDRFRADAILYTNAYTHAPLTLPAHASLLTGLLPYEHGVRDDAGYVLGDRPTIQRSLKANGYATGAAVSAYVLRGSTGLSSDFDEYDDRIPFRGSAAVGELRRPGGVTAEIAAKWIERRAPGEPFFYFLHLYEPHAPHEPEGEFRARHRDAYDGEIAAVDAIVGAFLDRLRVAGVYDKAIVLLLSDHGEGLGDHGEEEHGVFLYRETAHIPLLLKLPGGQRRGETVETPVGLVDVAPTIAALTGLSPLLARHGKSLLDLPEQRRIYVESLYPRIHMGWSELRSLAGGKYQYIEAPRAELYDLFADPEQRRNVIDREPDVAKRMRAELAGHRAVSSSVEPDPVLRPDPKDGVAELTAMARATRLMRARRWKDAAAAFREITARNADLSDAWSGLCRSLESAGRYEEAAEVYGRLIKLTPELAGESGLRRGAVLLELGRLEEAEAHARLAEATNRGAMYVLLARIEVARGNLGAAEAQARAAANDPNHRLTGELVLAQILAQQGRAAEALPLVEAVGVEVERLNLTPMVSYELVRGEVLGRLERHEEAIQAFRREIEHFPARRQAYASLYFIYMATAEEPEARRVLEQMVRANPGTATMLFAAQTAEAIGDTETAERWRTRAADAAG